ncbi:hypothetical protein CROQUDRAFT_477353 [Cronartium quercuum f. sp. fusiforme G11]|uniref:Uncharacterized protein n=1 Tax=Cronartium quercuum f. sp. fusiforme G11 TaxID=708437 RepID=A0A9P6NPR7_9BASI|nr:hypothetical protein CROQUDRAFT_477353 [Cronartium quercuum f. sp. fusiforme G11]
MFTSTLTRLQLHLINSTSDEDLVSPPKFDLPRLTHLNLKTTRNISLRSFRKCGDLKRIPYIQLAKKGMSGKLFDVFTWPKIVQIEIEIRNLKEKKNATLVVWFF